MLGQKDRPLGNALLLDSGTFEHSHSFEHYNKLSLYFNPLLLNQEEQVLKYSKVRRGIKKLIAFVPILIILYVSMLYVCEMLK